jgi:flagellar basal-body rod modification protein FlgD
MQVDATNTTTAQTNTETAQQTSSDAAASASLDYTAFLRLLVAEMKNQDPTNPSDPAEWMGQLASFSNVEQGIQTNTKLDNMLTSMALTQVDAVVGHTITAVTDSGTFTGKVASVRIITGGAVAVLEDGTQVLLGAGVEIS